MENEIDLVEVQNNELSIISETQLTEDRIAVIEKEMELRQRMLMACVKTKFAHDWIDVGGKPYLEGEGAERIAAVVGISIKKPEITRKKKANGHLYIEAMLEGTCGGRTVTEIGDCSSDDKFYQRKVYNPETKTKELKPQAPEDVNEADVVKKAIQNGKSRLICSMVGIKGLSWEDLEKLGLDRSKAGATVSYKKGGQGGSTQTQSQRNKEVENSNEVLEQTNELLSLILSHGKTAVSMGMDEAEFCREVTYFKSGDKEFFQTSLADIETTIKSKTEKFGLQKCLFPWKKNAEKIVQGLGG